MIVSNLRYFTDQTTFEPSAVVDVSIPLMTLYEVDLLNKEIQDDILLQIGKELVEQIESMRKKRLEDKE
jgi:hypothetical protein